MANKQDTFHSSVFYYDSKIYVHHTDIGGIVYHANYLVFYDQCRTEWFNTLGFHELFIKDEYNHIFFLVVGGIDIKYIRPLQLNQHIRVCIEKVNIEEKALRLKQSIYAQNDKNEWLLCNIAEYKLPCVQQNEQGLSTIPIPQLLKQAILSQEKT